MLKVHTFILLPEPRLWKDRWYVVNTMDQESARYAAKKAAEKDNPLSIVLIREILPTEKT